MTLNHPKSLLAIAFLIYTAIGISFFADNSSPSDLRYKTVENIAYRDEAGMDDYMREACRLDVYYPENSKGFATVVFFHGGGLTEGKRFIPEQLKRQGVGVVTVDYRLSPRAHSPAYVEDAAAAVAWVFKHIGENGGSDKRIFVTGHSAGGYLTLMIGLDKKWLAACGADADQIAGLVPFSGQAITHFTVRKERGISEKQPVVDEMAPLFHVRKDAPPLLLITGDRELELLGRYEENAYLWRMMKLAGHPDTQLIELPGLDHGGMTPPSYPILLKFISRISGTQSVSGEPASAVPADINTQSSTTGSNQ
ncbi:MAG: alpha/beta hydrolase [Verrucomicrobiota bacterium]